MRLGPIFVVVGALLLLFAFTYEEEDTTEHPSAGLTLGRLASLLGPTSPEPAPTSTRIEPCGRNSPEECVVFAADSGKEADLLDFWGAVECDLDDEPAAGSGERVIPTGGDPQPTATGRPQGDDSYRLMVTQEGDDLAGERCEIGRNDYRIEPITVFYREGDHLLTFISVFLPAGFPLDTESTFQGAVQMKQTQPSDVGDEAPPIALGTYQGRWQLFSADRPARTRSGGGSCGARQRKRESGPASSSTSSTRATRTRGGFTSTPT